jgi:hypothetical protein
LRKWREHVYLSRVWPEKEYMWIWGLFLRDFIIKIVTVTISRVLTYKNLWQILTEHFKYFTINNHSWLMWKNIQKLDIYISYMCEHVLFSFLVNVASWTRIFMNYLVLPTWDEISLMLLSYWSGVFICEWMILAVCIFLERYDR